MEIMAEKDVRATLERIASDAEETKKSAAVEAKCARIRTLLIAVLTAAVVLALVLTIPKVNAAVASANKALESANAAIDEINAITDTIDNMDLVGMSRAVTALAVNGNESLTVAMDELSVAMDNMNGAIARISAVDFVKLNSSIESLDGILTPMAKFFGVKK